MFEYRPLIQRTILRLLYGNPKILVKYCTQDVAQYAKVRYAKNGDAGLDLYNASNSEITINVGESVEVNAGLCVKIPSGYVGLLRCRSSTFAKRGLFVVHNTIDSGYTGIMFTHVWNPGLNGQRGPQIIKPWERLSQLVIVPYLSTSIACVDKLPETERGTSGFGSTGL